MKILHISDLHINMEFDINKYDAMLDELIRIVKERLSDDDPLFLVSGDIVDKGCPEAYKKAKLIFNKFNSSISSPSKTIHYLFAPGNHDLCKGSFEPFDGFISSYCSGFSFHNESVIAYDYKKHIRFLLVNTVFHKDPNHGEIELSLLEKKLKETKRPTVIVMHHTLMSRYKDDESAIRDAYAFLNLVEKNNVAAIIHGHTHGASQIVVGDKCQVIGVGSLFSHFPNCNNQFNIIDIENNSVKSVLNYRFNADLNNTYEPHNLFKNRRENYFMSESIFTAYSEIRECVKSKKDVNSLQMIVNSDYDSYIKEMTERFRDDIELAKEWLKGVCPEDSLYYNHGQYMTDGQARAIDYVIRELKRDSSGNRAIIPLINFKDILSLGSDYVPGLTSVQFGFENESKSKLYCSVYLRSLEVNHFLKINLSEIYLLVKELHNEIRSIDKVAINLFAFKAQYKEKFGCFRKAIIDKMSIGDIAHIVYHDSVEKILTLLNDKFDMDETIVNISGLRNLYDIMRTSGEYKNDVIDSFHDLICFMTNELRKEYERSSVYREWEPFVRDLNKYQTALKSSLRNSIVKAN
jgi:thymidylate synthase/UDP-2,3-diacylglucosamine pyrophosphatase LpxH